MIPLISSLVTVCFAFACGIFLTLSYIETVSYTHLTLPTKRIV